MVEQVPELAIAEKIEVVVTPHVDADSSRSKRIIVHFDDGPESGLLVDIAEDDICNDKFWIYEEYHKKRPEAKIVFADGLTMFVSAFPSEEQGVVVDEDGDAHAYAIVGLASVVDECLCQSLTRRPQRSLVVDDTEPELTSLSRAEACRASRRTRREDKDDDWTMTSRAPPAKRPRRTPRASVKKTASAKRGPRRGEGEEADESAEIQADLARGSSATNLSDKQKTPSESTNAASVPDVERAAGGSSPCAAAADEPGSAKAPEPGKEMKATDVADDDDDDLGMVVHE